MTPRPDRCAPRRVLFFPAVPGNASSATPLARGPTPVTGAGERTVVAAMLPQWPRVVTCGAGRMEASRAGQSQGAKLGPSQLGTKEARPCGDETRASRTENPA